MNPKPVKKKEDGVFDLEQQFILRLPPGPAMALRHDVQSGIMNLKEKLSIELASDARYGKVTYGGQIFNAKLVDLPCIIESLKTTDRKTFFKTADICQMLVCLEDDYESPDEQNDRKKKDKDKRYQWTHGICPPLKNVRKRRFRKTLQKKYQDQPDIENEVRRLFRADSEAIDVKWEIVYEQEEEESKLDDAESSMPGTLPALTETNVGASGNVRGGIKESISAAEIAEHDIFGELSSSSDDDDVNVIDSGDESRASDARLQRIDTKESLGSIDFGFSEAAATFDPDMSELHNKLQELGHQLDELNDRRVNQETELSMSIIGNSSQKDSLQRELDQVIEEENKKRQEYEILSSMLSQN
jgi:transcription initiation factor TFIID subunit 7